MSNEINPLEKCFFFGADMQSALAELEMQAIYIRDHPDGMRNIDEGRRLDRWETPRTVNLWGNARSSTFRLIVAFGGSMACTTHPAKEHDNLVEDCKKILAAIDTRDVPAFVEGVRMLTGSIMLPMMR